jgi:hypothetical protein
MFLLVVLFYMTLPALIWLAVHLVRFSTKQPLPDGLVVLLIAVAACWLIMAIAVFINYLDYRFG